MQTIRIEGTGHHCFTNITDAETGEDLASKYGVVGARLEIGVAGDEKGRPRLILELMCPVEVHLTGEPVVAR